jgi:hypothetical protein
MHIEVCMAAMKDPRHEVVMAGVMFGDQGCVVGSARDEDFRSALVDVLTDGCRVMDRDVVWGDVARFAAMVHLRRYNESPEVVTTNEARVVAEMFGMRNDRVLAKPLPPLVAKLLGKS